MLISSFWNVYRSSFTSRQLQPNYNQSTNCLRVWNHPWRWSATTKPRYIPIRNTKMLNFLQFYLKSLILLLVLEEVVRFVCVNSATYCTSRCINAEFWNSAFHPIRLNNWMPNKIFFCVYSSTLHSHRHMKNL
jgi:hypothetical protein